MITDRMSRDTASDMPPRWSSRARLRGSDPALPVLFGQIGFLSLFLGAGVWASPVQDADAAVTIAIGLFGVAAMAIQNAASRTIFSSHPPTTVMTGNVTQTVMDAVEVALGADAGPVKARLRKMLPPVVGFAIGAIAGGLGVVWFGFWCLIAPLLAMLYVAWQYHRRYPGNPDDGHRAFHHP
jgi:uncharacterized membrane protein YoaK (UPF0700 family)